MWKFFGGVISGLALSVVYVWSGIAPPGWMELPDLFKKSLNAAVVDDAVIDPDTPVDTRVRAIEVYFANQAKRMAALEAQAGFPLTRMLRFQRVKRDAQVLRNEWRSFGKALDQPSVRKRLEAKHGAQDRDDIKRLMLIEALAKKKLLSGWLKRHGLRPDRGNILEVLTDVSRMDRAPGR